MPVSVVKHCSLKFSDSRTSIPEGGSGRVWEERMGRGAGLRRVVIACTLRTC